MDTIHNNRKTLTTLLIVLIAFVAIKVASEIKAFSYIGKSTAVPNVITVSGKGEVLATPDIAMFSFTVSEEAATVGAAQKEAVEKMNSILDYIKKSGIEDKDIQTLAYDIYPRYDYQGASYYVPGRQVLAAYVVSQTVQVKVRKLEEAGSILSGIGEFGAMNVSGLSFSVDQADELAREARDKAIVDAREQAEKLAASLGVKLSRITSFYDQAPYQPYPMYKDGYGGVRNEASSQSVQLPSGESKITSLVTITYEIK
jgi:uncharacterized protein